MPNCFQLVNRETREITNFAQVDEELCEHLGIPVDDKKYCLYWYDSVGLMMAMGADYAKMKEAFDSPEMVKLVEFLEKKYEVNAWYEHK